MSGLVLLRRARPSIGSIRSKASRVRRGLGRGRITVIVGLALVALLTGCTEGTLEPTPSAGSKGVGTPTAAGKTVGTPTAARASYGLAPGGTPRPGPTSIPQGGDVTELATGAGIGSAAPRQLVEEWDIDITPDGHGLTNGSGTVASGAAVFASNCAHCHGGAGEGTPLAPRLVLDGTPGPYVSGAPRTVANYWPYVTTYMDYIRRAMPFDTPGTLNDEQLYAVVAWLLNQNGLLEEGATLDRDRVLQLNELPNLQNFQPCYPQACRPEPGLRGQ